MFKNPQELCKAIDDGQRIFYEDHNPFGYMPEVVKIDSNYMIVKKTTEKVTERKGKKFISKTQIVEKWRKPLFKEDGKTVDGDLWDFYDDETGSTVYRDTERLKIAVNEIMFLRKKLEELGHKNVLSYMEEN